MKCENKPNCSRQRQMTKRNGTTKSRKSMYKSRQSKPCLLYIGDSANACCLHWILPRAHRHTWLALAYGWHGSKQIFPPKFVNFSTFIPCFALSLLLQLVLLFNYVCRILEHQKEEKVGADKRKICDIIVTNMWHYFLAKWSWIWNGFLSSLSLYVTLRGNLQDGTFHYPALLQCICILMKIANIWCAIFVHCHGKSKIVARKSSVGFSQFSSNTVCSFVFDRRWVPLWFDVEQSLYTHLLKVAGWTFNSF